MRFNRLPLKLVQLLTIGTLFFPGVARAGSDPLMGAAPWDFQPQNRAAIAIAIRNAEDSSGLGGVASLTTIVCGGAAGAQGAESTGSSSSSTANTSCVIINNDSDGATAVVGQTSTGSQSSSASAQSSSTTTNTSIDEVAAVLGLPTP